MSGLDGKRARSTVIGPLGEALTLSSLPPAKPLRWSARRKAEIVIAVKEHLLPIEEALERYDLSYEEFASWQKAFERGGMRGLHVPLKRM